MGITCGSGIICGPIWGSFAVGDHLRSRDHLRRCTDRYFRGDRYVRDLIEKHKIYVTIGEPLLSDGSLPSEFYGMLF